MPVNVSSWLLQGIQDMLLQYLQLVIGFNTADQTVLITVIGGTNFVVQVRHGAWAQPLSLIRSFFCCMSFQILPCWLESSGAGSRMSWSMARC